MTKVSWRQGNGNHYVVAESNGEVLARVVKGSDGIWTAACFPNLRQDFWDLHNAKLAVQAELDRPPTDGDYEFIGPKEGQP